MAGFFCLLKMVRKFSFSIMVDAATWIPISVSVGKSGARMQPLYTRWPSLRP